MKIHWPSADELRVMKVLERGASYGLELQRRAKIRKGSIYVLLGRLQKKHLAWSEERLLSRGVAMQKVRFYQLSVRGERTLRALEAAEQVMRGR